tara:strand:- start:22 stop:465 length:444 start_codon:yes stop_codon:yes gene_type:complete
MKKLLLLLSLLIGSNLIALEKEVSSSFESTWSKVLLLMSAEGAKISFIDKSSGLLKASLSISRDALNTYYYQCRPPETVASITSDISVVVQEVSNDRSKIIINSKGVIESYRNRKFIIFNTSKIIDYNNCDSTGEYEKRLLQSLSKF